MRQQFPEDFIPPVVTTIVLSIFGVLSGINLLAFIYAFFNRRYPPIKAKQINLVAFYFLASVIWCIGLLQVYGFFGFEGIWQYCVLWRIWLKDVFGLGMILGFINFRFYSLYVVFVCGRSFADAPKLLPAVCYVAPYLSLAMVSMLRSDNVIQEKPGHFCSLKEWYGIAFMLVVGLSLLLAFYQCYLLRNISRSFNEYKTQVIGLSMIIFTYAVNLAFMKRPLPYMLEVKVGMFIMNLLTATIYIWLMIGSPIIGSLFYRQSYLEKFVSNLMADNAGVLSAKAVNVAQPDKIEEEVGSIPSVPIRFAARNALTIHANLSQQLPSRNPPPYAAGTRANRSEPDFRSDLACMGVYAGR